MYMGVVAVGLSPWQMDFIAFSSLRPQSVWLVKFWSKGQAEVDDLLKLYAWDNVWANLKSYKEVKNLKPLVSQI